MLGNVIPPGLRKSQANGKPARFPLGLQLSTSKVPSPGRPGRGGKPMIRPRLSPELCREPCSPLGFGYAQAKGFLGQPDGCVPPSTRYQALGQGGEIRGPAARR